MIVTFKEKANIYSARRQLEMTNRLAKIIQKLVLIQCSLPARNMVVGVTHGDFAD